MKPTERFDELLKAGDGARFKGEDFRSWCGPLVYMFTKADQALYVGYSRNGIGRAANPHRQALRARSECEELLVFPCGDTASAQELEELLIAELQPLYNKQQRRQLWSKRLGWVKTFDKKANLT